MTNGEKFKEVFGFGADGSRVIAVNATWWDSEFQNRKPIHAADVRPVVRGKWIKIKYRSICRDCSFRGFASWNFCPNCGADMREEN